MLQLKKIGYRIADKWLFREIDWVINPGRRLALIGPNGAGKTTLLRIINGELPPECGTMIKPRGYRIGYLPQEEIAVGKGPILLQVLEGNREVLEIEAEMAELHTRLEGTENRRQEKLLIQLGDLEHRFQVLGGYELESQAKKILTGLGFTERDFQRPVSEFSGGWRMRVYLARLLLQQPDLLLLDEPTNHLDLPSLEWLEDYLQDFPGSMIVVSHDRFFIDRLAQEIAELENKKLVHYSGNYHFYEKQKVLLEEQLLKRWEEIREEKEKLQRFIDRFRYKASKAPQVQSRIKRLEKLEEIELPKQTTQMRFRIQTPVQSYQQVCLCENLVFAYDGNPVLKELDFKIQRGERIALVGPNGVGKTTLTRLIAGELQPQQGKIVLGQRVRYGYYAQHQADRLNGDAKIIDEVSETAAPALRSDVRNVLGMFRFSGEDTEKKIGVLSGGEKARVSLAKILLSPVNFLIMDEPTNHLDAASKEALEQALADYDGTLLLISHDRYFLDKLVRRVFELQEGRLQIFEGNYSDYLRRRAGMNAQSKSGERPENEKAGAVARNKKERKRQEAQLRQSISGKRRKLEQSIAALEQQIDVMEQEKQQLEAEMAEPDFFADEQAAAEKVRRYKQLQEKLPVKLLQWENEQHELDELLNTI